MNLYWLRRLHGIVHDYYVQTMIDLSNRFGYSLHIMSFSKTVKYIKQKNCSVARYGDGELRMLVSEKSIGFQSYDGQLSKKLYETLQCSSESLLICMPLPLYSMKGYNKAAKEYWTSWKRIYQKSVVMKVRAACGKRYLFGNASFTRPYMDFCEKNRANVGRKFEMIQSIWEKRDILIVEGIATKFGIGNGLLDNAKSVVRLEAPSENAFDYYNEILEASIRYGHGKLVLIALGPTATILAKDLSMANIQAIDIGHSDIEYEWYLKAAKTKIPISGKYVNEANYKGQEADLRNTCYLSQIVGRIGC